MNKNNIELNLGDFKKSNYMEIIELSSLKTCLFYSLVFAENAQKEEEAGNIKKAKILSLLAKICSVSIKPQSMNDPYSPMFKFKGKRTFLPDDLEIDEIIFLEKIIEECKDYRIQSKIADILWIIKKHRNIKYLEIALSAYKKFDLNTKISIEFAEALKAYERAIYLTLKVKKPIDDLLELVVESFEKLEFDKTANCKRMSSLLILFGKYITKEIFYKIVNKLEKFALIFIENQDFSIANDYLMSAREWYHKFQHDDEDKEHELTVKIIQNLENLGDSKLYNLTASHFYNRAIWECHSIPAKYKGKFCIQNKLNNLYLKYTQSNQLGIAESSRIYSNIDISELIENNINKIKNKSINEAILALGTVVSLLNYNKIKLQFNKAKYMFPLCSTIIQKYYFNDGRMIASKEPFDAYIASEYKIHFELMVEGCIIPALEQFLIEHRVNREYLLDICKNSSIVLPNRVNIWTEGLYFGFEGEFFTSVHILIPQIEHLIRTFLKQNYVKTTILDEHGIESEKSINSLLKEEKLIELIGINLVEELKMLLINQIPYNLRNDISHGLVDDDTNNAGFIYLWWLCLRLVVVNSVWST
ncbi:DUF4209 domain-containing protein [Campylobacter geochelonis]|uniref:Uncharacterized protein n=1 Tax=Campylobacter geochelonis TaxID=1780362 RepID=A0A128EIV7_9BACT|nr:DUF4209 domain-containing protein [Campylobacter geochelonis]QKF71599.1 DUF4209 domain-containing protein [Campylobacter geochelonis]CZE48736.1 Uncharacterised protein [Campylobacter geochelonis]